MTDFATQRKSMVDSQVRPSDVTDRRIPRAMLEVPREAFVPGALRAIAYMDEHLKVGDGGAGRYLLAPRTLAKLLQHLDIADNAVVLDVGTATGYSAAILARMARRVVALESDPVLAERAQALLAEVRNVVVVAASLAGGVPAEGPFDAILLNGSVPDVPPALLDQLKDRGSLVAVRVENGVGKATLWRRFAMQFDRRTLFDAGAPPLPGFERSPEFVF